MKAVDECENEDKWFFEYDNIYICLSPICDINDYMNYMQQKNVYPGCERTVTVDPICSNNESEMMIEFTTDSKPKENVLSIQKASGKDKGIVVKRETFLNSHFLHFMKVCLPKDTCRYKLRLKDKGKDGICCDYGQGGYNISYNGEHTSPPLLHCTFVCSYNLTHLVLRLFFPFRPNC